MSGMRLWLLALLATTANAADLHMRGDSERIITTAQLSDMRFTGFVIPRRDQPYTAFAGGRVLMNTPTMGAYVVYCERYDSEDMAWCTTTGVFSDGMED